MSATISRGGRKGEFACYHFEVYPGDRTFLASGRWLPPKEHLATFRKHILDKTPEWHRFKSIVSIARTKAAIRVGSERTYAHTFSDAAVSPLDTTSTPPHAHQLESPAFTKRFGPARPDGNGKGKRSSVFGHETELKVAPKIEGVDKTHPDIHWLKLRSFILYIS